MRFDEIYDPDDIIWRTKHGGNSFYVSYEELRRRYISLTTKYDKSTSQNIVKSRIKDLHNIQKEISEMLTFCKNSAQDTETEEFMKSLKLMYHSCKSMIEDLKKYL